MAQARNAVDRIAPTYTLAGDFCRIFAEDMNSLYRLSFLLTADDKQAEQVFSTALEDCISAAGVFKEWARAWARRAVVQNAIRLMQPACEHAEPSAAASAGSANTSSLLESVVKIPTFERLVFVMSVLERYSDQDCKILLGCTRQDVVLARSQAVERLAGMRESSKDESNDCRFDNSPFIVAARKHDRANVPDGLGLEMSA